MKRAETIVILIVSDSVLLKSAFLLLPYLTVALHEPGTSKAVALHESGTSKAVALHKSGTSKAVLGPLISLSDPLYKYSKPHNYCSITFLYI